MVLFTVAKIRATFSQTTDVTDFKVWELMGVFTTQGLIFLKFLSYDT